jgi:cobalt-zinc-cadmium efflux system membrane fusion protein
MNALLCIILNYWMRPTMLRIAIAMSALALLIACKDGDDSAGAAAPSGRPASSSQASSPATTECDGESHSNHDAHADKEDHHSEGEDTHGEGAPLALSDADIVAAGIKVVELKEQPIADRLTLAATVQPDQSRVAHVAPKVSGRIVKVATKLGDEVKRGQLLATIDSVEVGEAQADYLQAQSELDLARASWERSRQLFEEQIIPQKDFLHAQAELDKAQAAERAASSKLRLLGVDRPSLAKSASSSYSVQAPLSGTVIEIGDAVQGELATPEEPLFTVADLSPVWVQASVAETDLRRVRVGAPAAIEVAAYPGERFHGRVTYVSSVLDKETRTVQARIEVPNPKGRLKVEMFATAFVESEGVHGSGLVVPPEAVVLIDGKPTLFVHEDGRFEPRNVVLGPRLANGTVVSSGVEPGERAVVAGAYTLKARILKSQMGEGHAH